MYIIQRNNETDSAGSGVATQEQAAETTKQEPENASTEDGGSENGENEDEKDIYVSFESEDENGQGDEGASSGASAASPNEKTVSESVYSSLKEQYDALKVEFDTIKQALENPLVKASLDFVIAKGVGIEVDPHEFYTQKFGFDVKRMSDEQVIEAVVKANAKKYNINLTEDELAEEIEKEKEGIERLGRIQQKQLIEKYRSDLQSEKGYNIEELIASKTKDIEEGQQFWASERQRFLDEVEQLSQSKKREFHGFKYALTEHQIKAVKVANDNSLVRFREDKKVDTDHYFEVCLFASSPQKYLKAHESYLRQKWEAESTAKRKGGQETNPSNPQNGVPTVVKGDLKGFSLQAAKPVIIKN